MIELSELKHNLNFRLLNYFVIVAKHGSFNRAAHAIQITQPALSRHICRLEHDLGHVLFQRHHSGVELTEAGNRLLEVVPALLDSAALVREALDNEPSGKITIGSPSSMMQLIIMPAIQEIRRIAPKIALRVIETNSGELRALINHSALDFAIVADILKPSGDFDFFQLVDDPVMLVRPIGGNALSGTSELTALTEQPLIGPPQPSALRMLLEEAMRQARLRYRVSIECETLSTVSEMLKLGLGQAVMPACALYRFPNIEAFAVSRLNNLSFRWMLAVDRKRSHVGSVRRVVTVVRETVERHLRDGTWPG